ncbi:MAG: HDIG domain-containing protein [Prevotellaceae bacterium]|jgi:putative nucleotidyltransferase with HDIG domain|nr:HDIG domain-containing protein [Prevotellaceae bacterium]
MKIKKIDSFTLAAFLATAMVLTILLPNKGKFTYDYQKGQPWMYETLLAPFDFPILKTEEEIRREREVLTANMRRYFVFKNQVEAEQLRNLTQQVRPSPDSLLLFEQVIQVMDKIYQRGIISLEQRGLIPTQGVVTLVQGMVSYDRPGSELFDTNSAEVWLVRMLTPIVGSGREQLLINKWQLSAFIAPNLQYDEKTTMAVQGSRLSDIAPTKGRMNMGELIVAKGAVLDEETVQILDSFKDEYDRSYGFSGNRNVLLLGHFLAMLLNVAALFVLISFVWPLIFTHRSFLLYCLLQMPVMLAVALLIGNLSSGGLYIIPFAVFALYTAAFFPSKIALTIYWVSLFPIAVIAPHGIEWLFLNAAAGAVAVFVFHYWNRGSLQFFSALIIFIAYTVGYISFRLIEAGSFASIGWRFIQYFLWNALFIIAVYPVVYLLEHIFGFVSESRLKDLSDPTTSLLQLLSQKAPGTMQHALQVANLAEAGARSIGANALLARVGALYHDIGKIANPMFFIENQTGINPHEHLTPVESAKIVLSHVEEGMVFAKKYRLPFLVYDFILTHHGHTQTAYFYRTYCDQGGDPTAVHSFTYSGHLPRTKEEVIVMIADAVEASTRSLTDFSAERITEMVERMVSERLTGQQLSQSDISIKEINTIKEIFISRLQDIYHQRIAY